MPTSFNPQSLIALALSRGVLKFGEFSLKSGRISPYFFNAGLFNDGEAIAELARGYASQLLECGEEVVLFGPAYKGIPLVAATAASLWADHGKNFAWGFNRKEAKDHGEGGVLVGASVAGKQVWILDDVMTAGTAVREVMSLLTASGASVAGVIVALDRQERGQGDLSAIQEVERDYGLPVKALIRMTDLMDYLASQGQQDDLARMEAYRSQYGV